MVTALRASRTELLDAVARLGAAASMVSVTEAGGWTARDVVAHLVHYAGQIAFGLGAPLTPPRYVLDVTERLSPEEWNERAVAYWRDHSLDDVLAEFVAVTDHVIERASVRSDEEMANADLIAWAPSIPLWKFIGGDTFLHEWPEHTKQIVAAVRDVQDE